jgi:hypothetical protein
MTPAEKSKYLDEIKQDKIKLAKEFNARG